MKVLLLEPQKEAREVEIDNSLQAMQQAVGGYIEAVYPFTDPVAIVCNEEGKLMGLPLNRALRTEDGASYDIITGTCFVCGLSEENFDSLSPDLLAKYKTIFRDPEIFLRVGDKIRATQVSERFFSNPPQKAGRDDHGR